MLLVAASLFLIGCGGNEPTSTEGANSTPTPQTKSIDYDEMAQGFCACMQPMFDFQSKVMKLLAEGKQEEIEGMREEAMQVQKDGEACILTLEEKYGTVEGVEEEEKATAALEKACPDIMEMMGDAAQSLEE